MLLHIGADNAVAIENLIMVLNDRGMTADTRAFIDAAKAEHRYRPASGAPKAYVVVRERGREWIYASAIAAATLEKRLRDEQRYRFLSEAAVLTAFLNE